MDPCVINGLKLEPSSSPVFKAKLLRSFEVPTFTAASSLLIVICLARQAEPEGFSHFHLYVCAAFLVRWRKEILEERDFQVTHTRHRGKRGGG